MSNGPDNEPQKEYRRRFGQIAVTLGFINAAQLKEALNEQIDDDLAGVSHRFIGEILLERRWLSFEQIDIILDELFKEEMRMKGRL